jgi:hypothetical protein
MVAVPLPLSVKVTVLGKEPVSLKLGVGVPEVVTVNELAIPAVNVTLLPLVIVGGVPVTFSVAVLLVAPGPLSVEVITLVVFSFVPVVVPVTFTEIVHEPLAATVPPDKLIEPEPATAVVVPPQVLLAPFGVETTSPAGKVSLNAKPLRLVEFGFVMVNVRLVLAFSGIELAPKALLMVGGVATVTLADAVFPVPPLFELTAPVVLFFTPEVAPVTFTPMVHEVFTPTVPPLRLTLPLPPVAVNVPPQVLVTFGEFATTNPAGNVSVNAKPVSATVFAAGLVIVKVSVVVPFTGMVAAPKAFAMEGGAATVSTWVADAVPAEAVKVGAPAFASL